MIKNIFTKANEKKINIAAISFSVFSNILALLTASVMGFFLPRFTSVDTYAQYRVFVIIYSYLGFFHLGFVDGINLKYGGFDYNNLPKRRFRMYSRFLFVFQFSIQFFLCLVLFLFFGNDTFKSPVFWAFMCLIPCVFNAYFAFIEQFTKRFFIDGIAQILQNAIMIIGFSALIITKDDDYFHFILIMYIAYIVALIFQTYCNRIIVFGKAEKISYYIADLKDTIIRGFFVMISQFMSIFVVTFDSVIVNIFLQTYDFAMYTFSVSIVTFMFQLTAVISKLIFPYLKRMKEEEYPNYYEKMKIYIILFSSMIAGLSLVFVVFIPIVIPNYCGSITILKILGISVVFKGVQELVCGNFFKVLNFEKSYAKVNVFAFVLAVVSDGVAFWLFHNSISVAVASVITFASWLCVSDIILRKRMNIKFSYAYLMMMMIAILYYICILLPPLTGVIVFYLALSLIIVFLLKKYPIK